MFCNITNSVTDDRKVEMNFVGDQRFMIECIYQLIKMYFDTYKKEGKDSVHEKKGSEKKVKETKTKKIKEEGDTFIQ